MGKAFDMAELQALREFFAAWEHLHAIAKTGIHRKQAEDAALEMVSKAQEVRRLQKVVIETP